MIGLPPALSDWSEDLDVFPRDVALSLLCWLPRFAASIGPMASRHRRGDWDFDGFGGIERRGTYDRLLLSEWLLADEVPDEFLRRAAMAEHNFLEVARLQPEASNQSVALFDAGPNQFGAPRIAHLAALIVLNRRAREAKARFVWGILQDDGSHEYGDVDEQSVLRLLRGRSSREAKVADVERWLGVTSIETDHRPDDLWIIGGKRVATVTAKFDASRLTVDESIGSDDRTLDVLVARAGDVKRSIELDLPAPRLATRLVRNPFEVDTRPPPESLGVAPDLGSSLRFAHDGRRVFLRSGTGVQAYPVARQRWEQTPLPRFLHSPHGPIIAITAHRKRFYVLSADERGLWLTSLSRGARIIHTRSLETSEPHSSWYPGPDAPLQLLVPRGRGRPPQSFVWADIDGRLWHIVPSTGVATCLRHDVVSLSSLGGGPICMTRSDDHEFVLFAIDAAGQLVKRSTFKSDAPLRDPFLDQPGNVLARITGQTWRRFEPPYVTEFAVPDDHEIIGTAIIELGKRQRELVAISPDRLRIRILRIHSNDAFDAWTSEHRIRSAALYDGSVVVRTEREELVTINLSSGGAVTRHVRLSQASE